MVADYTKVLLRRLRLVKVNRNLLVFLVFLAISIVFWFMQSIKEMTEVSITYKLSIENVPKNIIYTTDLPQEINVNYVGRGWDAFYYKFLLNEEHKLSVNFKDIKQPQGKIVIDANIFRRAVMKIKPKELAYSSTTPSKVEVFYSNGRHKRVPVIFDGHVTTTNGRYLCGTHLKPDSVDVYAPDNLYASITSINTEFKNFDALEDTIVSRMALFTPHGTKTIPDSISVELCVDIFTDKTIQVPIYSEDVPNNKILRIFPQKATVTFLVSATLYDEINADKFLLVVNYQDTKTDSKKCKVDIRQQPENIHQLRINPEYVEYIIEQSNE